MRNIANVVHDLEGVIVNHKAQVEMLINDELTPKERKSILDSIFLDCELLEGYIARLKKEAQINKLEKAIVKD